MRAVISALTSEIGVADLPPLQAVLAQPPSFGPPCGLERVEKEAILAALDKTGGHHERTAKLLGISRKTLGRKLKLYRAEVEEGAVHVV